MNNHSTDSTLDTDLRVEILRFLKKNRNIRNPNFPTEFAAIAYISLGTLQLLHEATMNHNSRLDPKAGQVQLHYPGALQEVIQLLQTLEQNNVTGLKELIYPH